MGDFQREIAFFFLGTWRIFVVKMRGVQVKAGIFDEKIHDLGVKCACLFDCLFVCLFLRENL